MVKHINIALENGAHDRIKEWKDERDMTWAQVLTYGVMSNGMIVEE